MESKNFDFDTLKLLLGLSRDDPLVRDFFGATTDFVERDEFTGSLEFKSEGIGVSFVEGSCPLAWCRSCG